MSVGSARKRLSDAERTLMMHWDRVSEVWDDAASRRFYEEHVGPLVPAVRSATQAMGRMHDIVERAKRECG